MKNSISLGLSILLLAVAFLGTACAGDQGDQPLAGEEVIITGSLDANNQFVDENGQAYTLTENQKGAEMLALSGTKLQIKGTLLEQDGQKMVTVSDYRILEE